MTCFSRVFIRRSRPSAFGSCVKWKPSGELSRQIQMKTRKRPRVVIKSRCWHKMFRCQAEITRHVRPAALAILIYITGYIYPAASMAMYSTQSAQDRLPPDSTPALWFLTQRSAAWQHHESCPTECTGDEIQFWSTAYAFDFYIAESTALCNLTRTRTVWKLEFKFLIVNKGIQIMDWCSLHSLVDALLNQITLMHCSPSL